MKEYASLAIMNTVSISGLQPPVHERHLQFVFVIRNRANAAQQHGGRARGRVIHQKPVEGIHLHVGVNVHHFAKHLDALFHGEERLLGVVPQDRNDQPVEHPRAPLDQVEVAVGNRVERSRIDSDDVRRLSRQTIHPGIRIRSFNSSGTGRGRGSHCYLFFPAICHSVNGDRAPRIFTFKQYGTREASARSTAGRTSSGRSMVSPSPPNAFITRS